MHTTHTHNTHTPPKRGGCGCECPLSPFVERLTVAKKEGGETTGGGGGGMGERVRGFFVDVVVLVFVCFHLSVGGGGVWFARVYASCVALAFFSVRSKCAKEGRGGWWGGCLFFLGFLYRYHSRLLSSSLSCFFGGFCIMYSVKKVWREERQEEGGGGEGGLACV